MKLVYFCVRQAVFVFNGNFLFPKLKAWEFKVYSLLRFIYIYIYIYIYMKNAAYIVSCTLFDCKACISPYGYFYPLVLINGFACCKYLEDGAVVLVDNLFILIFFQRDCRQSFKGNFSVKKSADFSCPQYIKGLSSCTTR